MLLMPSTMALNRTKELCDGTNDLDLGPIMAVDEKRIDRGARRSNTNSGKKHAQLEYGVSCLDINPIGDNPNYSKLAAVSMWTGISVKIFSLPDHTLNAEEHLGGEIIPRSVLLCASKGNYCGEETDSLNTNGLESLKRMANDTNVTAPVNVTGVPVTNTVEPPAEGQPSNAQAVQAMEEWKHSDFLCHNYVLNGLVDDLYNAYCKTTIAKELWELLERKYKTKDVGTKKLVVLLHDIHAEVMTVSEAFQVASIIKKLPLSWVDFKNYLKHKRKEMSVEDLIVRLCIEEDNKLAQKNTYAPDSAKANMVEHAGSSSKSNSKAKGKGKKKNDKKGKGKAEYLAHKARIMKHQIPRDLLQM
ncbi:pol polyprotein [Tanacetum coccineum]